MSTKDPATAEHVIEVLSEAEWPLGIHSHWGVEGLDVPGTSTYVNSIDTHVEGDYVQWYLVEVCDVDDEATEHYMGPDRGTEPSQTGETWVSYLAVCTMYGGTPFGGGQKVYWQWHHSRAPFFDRTTHPIYDIRVWFLNFVEDTPGEWDKDKGDYRFGW